MNLPSLERLSQSKVLVVGDVMLDRYWYGSVDRISPEAPVPVVRVTREEDRLGGSANVAYNVVTLGAQVSLLSVVGDDEAIFLTIVSSQFQTDQLLQLMHLRARTKFYFLASRELLKLLLSQDSSTSTSQM